jgi:hypothetical protein
MTIAKFVLLSLVIVVFGYIAALGMHDDRPRLPDSFRNRTPPNAAALATFRERTANGGWIGRSQRELAELLGPPYVDHLSCEGSSECAWLVSKIDDDSAPNGVLIEVLYTEPGGFVDTMDGVATRTAAREPAIHRAILKEYHFRN